MKNRALHWQTLRFIGVGGSAAMVYFSAALLFDRAFGLPPVWASILAYVASAAFSFLGHKLYTFNTTGNSRAEAIRFAISAGIGFLLASLIPYLLSSYSSVYSYLAVLVIVPTVSFIMLKCFVFSEG
jgi:putative flippase GtrA